MACPTLTLVCHCCQAGKVPAARAAAIMASLRQAGEACLEIDDFCGWAAQHRSGLPDAVAGHALRLIGCQPRALRWLATWAGLPPPVCLEAATLTPADLGLDAFVEIGTITKAASGGATPASSPSSVDAAGSAGAADASAGVPEGRWIPWFPVIDRERCNRCGKCMAFCLFGVYSRGASGEPLVTAPASCKNNCPACARSCPQQAIIFPKYAHAPINGGEGVDVPAGPAGAADPLAGFAAQLRRRRSPPPGDLFRD